MADNKQALNAEEKRLRERLIRRRTEQKDAAAEKSASNIIINQDPPPLPLQSSQPQPQTEQPQQEQQERQVHEPSGSSSSPYQEQHEHHHHQHQQEGRWWRSKIISRFLLLSKSRNKFRYSKQSRTTNIIVARKVIVANRKNPRTVVVLSITNSLVKVVNENVEGNVDR